jgi:hypothetical protein
MHHDLQKLAKTLSAFSRKHELVQFPNRELNLTLTLTSSNYYMSPLSLSA